MPRARRGLVLIPQHFGALLFDRTRSRYYPFDHESSRLLERLGRASVGRVLEEIPLSEERAAVEAFCVHLLEGGFLTPDGRLSLEILQAAEVPEGHLLGPLATHVEVVGACNLSCEHCFASPLPRHDGALSLEELDRLFGELAALGSFRLGLTGGEPLLRQDLLEILDRATARGLHPCLTTNALLLDEAMARELGRRDMIWLNVSLDGATPETNDAVRGAGTFAAVRERLRLLARHARFTLAFTLMRPNLHEIEDCARLAAEVGAHTAVFRPLYPVGSAGARLEWMPDYEEYAGALERLARVPLGEDFELAAVDPFSPTAREEGAARVVAAPSCGAGTTVASVSVRGEVSPCSFLGAGWVAGNLREQSFRDLWNRGAEFSHLRSGRDSCGSCEAFDGGCRARAQAFGGSAHDADPWQRAWETHRRGPGPLGNVELLREDA